MFDSLHRRLESGRGLAVMLSVALSAVLVLLDYASGPFAQFPVTYLFPIVLLAWYRGAGPGLVLSLALTSARAALALHVWQVNTPAQSYANALLRLVAFGTVAVLAGVAATRQRRLVRIADAHRRSEGEFRALVENMPSGVAHCRMVFEGGAPTDYVFLRVNAAYARLTGQTDVVGRRVSDVVPGIRDSNPDMFAIHGRVAQSGAPESFETFVPATGDWYAVQSYRPAPGEFVAVFDVVTERKRAEESLRESRESLALAVEAGGVGLWDWDLATNRVRFSREWKRQLGYEEHEVADDFEEWRSRCHPDDLAPTLAKLEEFLAAPSGRFESEVRLRHRDGSWRSILARATLQTDAEGKPVRLLGSHIDVTERKRIEDELRRSRDELVRRNRQKDEFLATITHELRTPLNIVLGTSEALAERVYGPLTERQDEALRTVDGSARHLLRLIDDILDVAAIEADRVKLAVDDVDVAEACEAALLAVARRAREKGIVLECRVDPPGASLAADANRLRQMLVHLLDNAVRFTPEAGHVSLEAVMDAAGTRFVVEDTGVGMSASDVARLYESFGQLDRGLNRSFEGLGVGLFLVQRLAGLHGGSVEVESEPGKGSRFTLTLPLRSAVPAEVLAGA